MQEPLVLVRFRPTARQAVDHGLLFGLVSALAVMVVTAPVLALLAATDSGPSGGDASLMLGGALAVGVPPLAGAALGLLWGRRVGTEFDEIGVRPMPANSAAVQPWGRVVDSCAERHGGRVHMAAHLDGGAVLRLTAPYDGRLLAHDPGFETKYFTVCQLWETHRRWGVAV
jgi:predicted amidohydrolase